MIFEVERFREFIRDGETLLRKNFIEEDGDNHRLRPCAALHYYQTLEEADCLVIVTARDSGKLIGYFVFVLSPHPHYANTICAVEDSYYLDRGERKGKGLAWKKSVGASLISAAIAEAKRRGARKFLCMSGVGKGLLLKKLGLQQIKEVYSMWLDEDDTNG